MPTCSAVERSTHKCENNTVPIQFTHCLIMTPLKLITTRKLFHLGIKAYRTLTNLTHLNILAHCQKLLKLQNKKT